jgi:hypothetical protein
VGLSMVLVGAGAGLYNGPNYASMLGGVSPLQRSLASSIGALTRNMGFLAGTSLGSVAFGLLLAQFGGRRLMLAARSEVLSPQTVPFDAFGYAFSHLLLGCAALAAIGLLISLRYPNRVTAQVDAIDSAGAKLPG